MSFDEILLYAHSYLRWLVLVLFALVMARALRGWLGAREWTRVDERLHVGLVASIDVQLLVGLVLYAVTSPITQAFFASPGPAMKDSVLRFYGVEHLAAMLVVVVIIHVGRVRSKRANAPKLRHRRVWTTTLAALVFVLVSIPWPFLPYGRPLFRVPASNDAALHGAAELPHDRNADR